MRNKFTLALMALALMAAAPLPEANQEARAQVLFHALRCVVCQGESVAESQAAVAEDIRRLVRERIAGGQSDAQIKSALIAAYGEQVLMRPPFRAATYLLWFGPAVLLLLGGAVVFAYFGASRVTKK